MQFRIGQGYDIHRLEAGYPLWLGGIQMESLVGSLAHSDGDALLHAVIDALLGAAGLSDIGEHFPPSDPQYKGANSAKLLSRVMQLLQQAGYRVGNLDCTIFLERPKLASYKPLIRERLAELLAVEVSQVNVKAKTAEGLGDIGQGLAVAASASVMIIESSI